MPTRRGLRDWRRWGGTGWGVGQWAGWEGSPADARDRVGLGDKGHGAGVGTNPPHVTGWTLVKLGLDQNRGGHVPGVWRTAGVVRSGQVAIGVGLLGEVEERVLLLGVEVGESKGGGCGGDLRIDIISGSNDCRVFRLIGLVRLV